MKSWQKILLGIVIGGALGYAYYYFIGCPTGACPITRNPFTSVAYGGIIGLILTFGKSTNKGKNSSD